MALHALLSKGSASWPPQWSYSDCSLSTYGHAASLSSLLLWATSSSLIIVLCSCMLSSLMAALFLLFTALALCPRLYATPHALADLPPSLPSRLVISFLSSSSACFSRLTRPALLSSLLCSMLSSLMLLSSMDLMRD